MLTFLLTGFEPFDGAADNPSRRLVHLAQRLVRARMPWAKLRGAAAGNNTVDICD